MTEPVFKTECRVIYADTDAGRVVYNANYLRYFETGRSEMMRSWAISYRAIEERGFLLPVTESYIRYKAPARYDDLILIFTSLAKVNKFSCRFNYRIARQETERQWLLAKGFTVHACIDEEGNLCQFPADILKKIESLCSQE